MLEFFKRLFGGERADRPPVSPSQAALTGQRQAERSQRRTEQQFEHLVAGVRDYAIFLLDRAGNVLTWNAGAELIKGYRAEEIVGRHFSRFYPEEAVTAGWPAHELEEAAEGRFEDEGWRVRKDGTTFWANVVITALRDEKGELRGFLKITRDLTDRKQAEEKLRLSEERFRLMVEGVQDYAIFMLDPEGRVATWNAGARRLKGYAEQEIVGQHFSRFYERGAVERGWPEEELRRAAAEGRFEDEGWRVRKDGTTFWANVVITALRDEKGVLRGFVKVTRDLTERRRSEENARRLLQEEAARRAVEAGAREIERQREQLHVTLSSIGDAVVVTDANGDVNFLNPVAQRLTGWQQGEAAGQPVERVCPIVNEQTRRPIENPLRRVFRENVVVQLENHTALVGRDGREVPVEDSAAPIRDEGGEVVGAVLVFRDVTEARRAAEARLRLAAIVESSDDAIIGESLDGKIVSWNRGAERIFGYAEAEIVGRPLSVLVPPDRPDEVPGLLERIKLGEFVEHFETVRVRKDGGRVDVSLTLSPIRDAGGVVVGASKIARDVTARKEEGRRKDEFLALLAHELRNPLAPIRNALQVLRLAGTDAEAIGTARALMERQLQHMVRLVDDLLDVSRISQGKLQLRKERITLAAVIDAARETCEPLANGRSQRLTVTLSAEPVYVDGDKTRLAQAVCNLMNNAVKYSEPNTPVWLTAGREGAEAVIRVRDRGAGIAADMLPKVFDLFTQVDRTLEKSQGGLGVGLTIVKRLAEMHGGRVEAHSEGTGKGSEFVIRLPAVRAADPAREDRGGEGPARPLTRHRILVVDDNPDAADSLSMLLRIMGNEVRTARDGLEGVAAAAEFGPDVVLMDIGMPRLNGYDACRRLREQPASKDAVVIALTGWGQEEDKRRSQQAGFDGHLVKPVEPAALERLLEEFKTRPAEA